MVITGCKYSFLACYRCMYVCIRITRYCTWAEHCTASDLIIWCVFKSHNLVPSSCPNLFDFQSTIFMPTTRIFFAYTHLSKVYFSISFSNNGWRLMSSFFARTQGIVDALLSKLFQTMDTTSCFFAKAQGLD